MTKKVPCRFKQSFGPFTMFTVHKCFNTRLFKRLSNRAICSLHLFFPGIPNFKHLLVMQKKSEQIFFDFEVIAFELLALDNRYYWERILVWGVNILTNSFKISDTTKIEYLELISFHNNQRIWQKYCHAHLSNLSDPLTCWLCISVLTRGFYGT